MFLSWFRTPARGQPAEGTASRSTTSSQGPRRSDAIWRPAERSIPRRRPKPLLRGSRVTFPAPWSSVTASRAVGAGPIVAAGRGGAAAPGVGGGCRAGGVATGGRRRGGGAAAAGGGVAGGGAAAVGVFVGRGVRVEWAVAVGRGGA